MSLITPVLTGKKAKSSTSVPKDFEPGILDAYLVHAAKLNGKPFPLPSITPPRNKRKIIPFSSDRKPLLPDSDNEDKTDDEQHVSAVPLRKRQKLKMNVQDMDMRIILPEDENDVKHTIQGESDSDKTEPETVDGDITMDVADQEAEAKKWKERKGESSDETDQDSQGNAIPPRPRDAKRLAEWYRMKRELTLGQDARAALTASQQEMKPDFPCPATRQRKKAYRLDPTDPHIVIPKSINRFLRRYQRVGVQFMYDRWKGVRLPNGLGVVHGGVLGDDMGLGKTVQVIAFLSAIMEKTGTKVDLLPHRARRHRIRERQRLGQETMATTCGPTCLIACPKVLIDNWLSELATWGNFDVATLEGSSDKIKSILNKYRQGYLDVLLCTLDRVHLDIEILSDLRFSVVIVDEAHYLKSASAGRTQAFKRLKADARFALTGTLMQNRYDEMWSVLDFVAPGQVGSQTEWHNTISLPLDKGSKFDAEMGEIAGAKDRAEAVVNHILPNFFIRRTKALIADELPTKKDQVVFCPLTPTQEMVYERIANSKAVRWYLMRDTPCEKHPGNTLEQCCQAPPKDDRDWKGAVLKFISIFRKISSHIGQVYPHKTDTPEQRSTATELLDICFPEPPEDEEILPGTQEAQDMQYRRYTAFEADQEPNFSGKWLVLRALLRTWYMAKEEQNKVLIFSESVRLLRMLEFFIESENYTSEFLYGDAKDRTEMVQNFQRGDRFVFLISTGAGGVGLNLTKANKVVIFDPSWNPAKDLQAMDRAFRMGQKRNVDVYRLISLGTLEENIYERQLKKQSAMRIAYDASTEARLVKGSEYRTKGASHGELWGAKNLFEYHREGTTLQRDARLQAEEDEIRERLRSIDAMDSVGGDIASRVTTLKIDTLYSGDDELDDEGKKKDKSDYDNSAVLDLFAQAFPGLRREAVPNKSRATEVERHIYETAAEQIARNGKEAANMQARDFFKSELHLSSEHAKRLKAKREKKIGGPSDIARAAPKLKLTKGKEQVKDGLISSDSE